MLRLRLSRIAIAIISVLFLLTYVWQILEYVQTYSFDLADLHLDFMIAIAILWMFNIPVAFYGYMKAFYAILAAIISIDIADSFINDGIVALYYFTSGYNLDLTYSIYISAYGLVIPSITTIYLALYITVYVMNLTNNVRRYKLLPYVLVVGVLLIIAEIVGVIAYFLIIPPANFLTVMVRVLTTILFGTLYISIVNSLAFTRL